MPVKPGLRVPETGVETVDLADGVLQHKAVAVVDGIPCHKVQSHVEVVGPEGVLFWPGTDQSPVGQAGLAVTDVFSRFLDNLLVILHTVPSFYIYKGAALCPDEIQFVEAAESVERMPVSGRRIAGTDLGVLLKTVAGVFYSVLRIAGIAAEGGIFEKC